jgi:hypothetical protein
LQRPSYIWNFEKNKQMRDRKEYQKYGGKAVAILLDGKAAEIHHKRIPMHFT